jgi:MFS family permease
VDKTTATAASKEEQPGASPLAAFRYRTFTIVWVATLVSNIGGWMYGAASGWLMTSLTGDAFVVSLVQVASNAPLFLFALVAGALSDTVDKRRLLIVGESVTAVLSAAFAAMVLLNLVTPASLLWFIFLISIASALTSPAWQAIVPSLVPKAVLPSAISANSAGFNVSRAIGPALAGAIIGPLGIGMPFVVNAVSNFGVIGALVRWRPAADASALEPERFASAIGIGLRYAANNPGLRKTFVRTVAFFVFASAYWALLPLVARTRISGGAEIYGILLGAIGLGAVGGALATPYWKMRIGPDNVVALASAGTAVALVLFGIAREPFLALIASVVAGVSWIAGVATLNVSAQIALPNWVRGRGLAMYITVMFGAITIGSAIWGQLASITSLSWAHFAAAAGIVLAIPLTWRWKLPAEGTLDLTPSMHWPAPVISRAIAGSDGPVLVAVEYHLADEAKRRLFLTALVQLRQERLRDGAYAWGTFEDTAQQGRFLETFFVSSWTEHLRQHDRVTNADAFLQRQMCPLLREEPIITHLIAPDYSAPPQS